MSGSPQVPSPPLSQGGHGPVQTSDVRGLEQHQPRPDIPQQDQVKT